MEIRGLAWENFTQEVTKLHCSAEQVSGPFFLHTMRVPVHKIQSFSKHHAVVWEKQLSYVDSNTAASLDFVLITQASSPGPISSNLSSVIMYSARSLTAYNKTYCSKTFHIFLNCCPICNRCNRKLIQIYDNSCMCIIHNA